VHVLAVAAAGALAWDAVLIPVQLGVACLVGGNCLSAVLEGGAALSPSCTRAEHEDPKASNCGNGGWLHGKKAYWVGSSSGQWRIAISSCSTAFATAWPLRTGLCSSSSYGSATSETAGTSSVGLHVNHH
jgi:hypothetical protein